MKIGLGVGTFLYVFRESMEDGGASFAELEKEVEALKKLEPLIVMDPHTDAESDPKKKLEVLKQFVKTYQAARPNLDKLRTKLVMVARATGPQADSAVLLAALTASTYFPAGTPPNRRSSRAENSESGSMTSSVPWTRQTGAWTR
ncbi:hypothetical protein ACGFSI_34660 [Streptomyces virginiae]|uniref:hypothetical protein n=1 Tax=Streptomyces virginiae TaxID=1961 RepID=UPI0037165AF3